ncbi:hypothetical protein KBY90_04205 [Cyanobium sp. CH-040]|nr:hypothetical protein [Cyanobium sp. CH-040]
MPAAAGPAGAAAVVRPVLRLWALALALSSVLAAAGGRWPRPLVPDAALVWSLVLGPPLLMALWLAATWRLHPQAAAGDRGESSDRIQERD